MQLEFMALEEGEETGTKGQNTQFIFSWDSIYTFSKSLNSFLELAIFKINFCFLIPVVRTEILFASPQN